MQPDRLQAELAATRAKISGQAQGGAAAAAAATRASGGRGNSRTGPRQITGKRRAVAASDDYGIEDGGYRSKTPRGSLQHDAATASLAFDPASIGAAIQGSLPFGLEDGGGGSGDVSGNEYADNIIGLEEGRQWLWH